MPDTTRAGLDLSRLAGALTARIDGYRDDDDDGATWEATPGDRDGEIVLAWISPYGATAFCTIRVQLEEL